MIAPDTPVRVRVRYDDGTTDTVLHERVRVVNARRPPTRVEPIMPPALEAMREASPHPALRAVPKPARPMRDAAFLAFVREKRCMSCHIGGPSEAHHFGPRGMGEKTDDYRASPLCRECHQHFHDHGTLPRCSREDTEQKFARNHAIQLVQWFGTVRCDPVIVDALVAHARAWSAST